MGLLPTQHPAHLLSLQPETFWPVFISAFVQSAHLIAVLPAHCWMSVLLDYGKYMVSASRYSADAFPMASQSLWCRQEHLASFTADCPSPRWKSLGSG